MQKINNYKQLKKISKEILKEKGQATASDISGEIRDNYKNTRNLTTTPRKISFFLKEFPRKQQRDRFLYIYDGESK